MKTAYQSSDIEHILSQADEMLSQLDAGLAEDMEENRRTQLEIHATELKKRRAAVAEKTDKENPSDYTAPGDGMHQAIEEIVKAMKSLTRYLT